MLQLLDELTFPRNPWREFERLHSSLNQLLPNTLFTNRIAPVNIYSNKDALKVVVSIPGWQADWFDLAVEGNTLHLKGTSKREDGQREQELRRVISLPFRVQGNKVNASYTNGLLTIDLVRHEQDKPRKIKIHAA